MLLILAFAFMSVCAHISNVTIDDALGDEHTGHIPRYLPDNWVSRSTYVGCDGCKAQPDPTHIYKGTWHDRSTFAQDQVSTTVSMVFSGTRIYVYFILFNNIGTLNNNTRLRFYLDGSSDPARDFLHLGNPAGERYMYNQLVYDSQALNPANHTLLISSYSNGTDGSVALFDRAIYTTGTDDNSATQNTSTLEIGPVPSLNAPMPVPTAQSDNGTRATAPSLGIVIGSAIASTLVLALVAVMGVWLCFWRYRGRARIVPLQTRLRPQGAPTVVREDSEVATTATSAVAYLRAAKDATQLRRELGWVREELARVRRIAEPPNYSHASLTT